MKQHDSIAGLALVVLVTGLVADCGPSNLACVPGASVPCACPDAKRGAQVCNAAGAGYEACVCAGTPDAAGSGGSNGTGEAGGSSGGGGPSGGATGTGGNNASGGGDGGAGGASGGGGGAAGSGAAGGNAGGGAAGAAGTGGAGGAAGAAGTSGAAGAAGASCTGGAAGTAGAGGASSGSRLYAILNGGTAASSLEIVDAVSWTLIRNVPIGVVGDGDMEVDPSGQMIYVTEGSSAAGAGGNLHVVSATTGADTGNPGPPVNLGALALSPDGTRLYSFLGSMTSTTITAIDTSSMTVVDSLVMTDGWNPNADLSLSPDGAMIAFEWFANDVNAKSSFRLVTAACKLGTYGTYENPPAPGGYTDVVSPVFTGDGRVLLYETNYESVIPFDIATSSYEPSLKLRLTGSYLGVCGRRCVGYDPISRKGVARGNHYDLGSFDLVSGSAGMIPLAPANSAVVRQVFARPGGGAFADVQYVVAAGVQAPPDTINDASGKVVYTFSEAKPVGRLRFKSAP